MSNRLNRLWQIVCLNFHRSASSRGRWVKKKHIFAECGNNVRYQIRVIPLCAKLIKIGNNVNVSTGAKLIVHDATHLIYNCLPDKKTKLKEYANPIQIGDNVFIGANVCIMGGVKIGSDVIIAAGAVVTKDLEAGGVYGGVPAKKIGNTTDFWKKREQNMLPTITTNAHMTDEEIANAWAFFDKVHKSSET